MQTNISLQYRHTYKNRNLDAIQTQSRQVLSPQNNLQSFDKISFKAKAAANFSNVQETLNVFEKEIGKSFRKRLESKLNIASQTSHLLKYDKAKNAVTIEHLTMFQKNIDLLKYPFWGFPLDIINFSISTLSKIPGLKILSKIQDAKVLKNRKIAAENTANLSLIENYFTRYKNYSEQKSELEKQLSDTKLTSEAKETIKKRLSKLNEDLSNDCAINSLNGYDKTKGNYNTTTERSLTRIVTGAIPAVFLANDAYNLSMYMTNDKKTAKEAKRKRFIQESIRIIFTAAATFYGLKLFAQKSNASKNFNAILVSVVTFSSEIAGRIIAGNPVLPVSEKKAKKIAKEREAQKAKHEKLMHHQQNKLADTPKTTIEKTSSKSTQIQKNTPNNSTDTNNQKSINSIITLKNAFGLVGLLCLFGFAQEKIGQLKPIKDLCKKFTEKYTHFLTKEQTVKIEDFNELINYLDKRNVGIASKYRKIRDDILSKGNFTADEIKAITTKQQQDGSTFKEAAKKLGIQDKSNADYLNLGRVSNKPKKIIIDYILASLLKFPWAVITAPYMKILKPVYSAITGKGKPEKVHELNKNLIAEILYNFKKMKKHPEKFEDSFNEKLLTSMDTETKSSISNAEVSVAWKNIANAITSVFLIIDNFNLVMIDTHGEDKDMASQKAKERTIQRIFKLLYGAFTQQLFSNTFARTFNGSLLGSETVNAAQTTVSEIIERKTVGLPLKESNRDDIINIEQENLHATGVKGSFYRGMAKVTGKRALSSKAEDKKQKVLVTN